jgi:hypothetical protein
MTERLLRIADFSDREILAIMADIADGAGEVTTGDLALRVFGLKETTADAEILEHAALCVRSRLAWMRRYGLVEKGEKVGIWYISEAGKRLRFAKLGRSFSMAISHTPSESVLEMAHQVGERMLNVTEIEGRAMQRELTWQINRRRRR